MKRLLLSAIVVFSALFALAQDNEYYMLVGTYTSTRPGGSEGVYVYRFNTSTGESVKVSSVAIQNPSSSASPLMKSMYMQYRKWIQRCKAVDRFHLLPSTKLMEG